MEPSSAEGWGTFAHYYELDFSTVETPGRYYVRLEATSDTSSTFAIGLDAYSYRRVSTGLVSAALIDW